MTTLLLVGIAIGAACSAAIGFFTFRASATQLQSLVFWQMVGAGLLGLVTADNLVLLFVFWELTTIFSFLLIGHDPSRCTDHGD